ncbi:MAG: hypothetical protein ABTQ93_02405, partial [Candidatus Competibacter denitrificans]
TAQSGSRQRREPALTAAESEKTTEIHPPGQGRQIMSSGSYSHSIVNKTFLSFIFNGLFSC